MAEVKIKLSEDFFAEIEGNKTWLQKDYGPVKKGFFVPNDIILQLAIQIQKQSKLAEREERFKNEVLNQRTKAYYPETMLTAFFDYWREPNKSGTKMRFELEKTWALTLRLQRWFENNNKFNKTNGTESTSGTSGKRIEALKQW